MTRTNLAQREAELISQIQSGSIPAFAELVEKYTNRLYNVAFRVLQNHHDTEEVLQDVFTTVYRKIDTFQGKCAFSSWIYRITFNAALMNIRKRKQSDALSSDEVTNQMHEIWSSSRSDTADISFISCRHELRAILENAISVLPQEHRIIFVLRDIDGLSNQRIAETLGLSVSAVKSKLHRARLSLRKRLWMYYQQFVHEIFNGEVTEPPAELLGAEANEGEGDSLKKASNF